MYLFIIHIFFEGFNIYIYVYYYIALDKNTLY